MGIIKDRVIDMMNAEQDVRQIAAKMLDIAIEDVPSELINRLCRTAAFIHKVRPAGDLRSTQVIASMVEQWVRDEYRDRPTGRHPGC